MSIRDSVNRHSGAVAVIAVVCVLMAVLLTWRMRQADSFSSGSSVPQDFYTIDDGKTWFADSAEKFPPFDYNGKLAYRCRIWTSDGGKTPFVSHLERYPPAVKQKLESMSFQMALDTLEIRAFEVKPPLTGDTGWVDVRTPQGAQITTPKSPNGGATILPVAPP